MFGSSDGQKQSLDLINHRYRLKTTALKASVSVTLSFVRIGGTFGTVLPFCVLNTEPSPDRVWPHSRR